MCGSRDWANEDIKPQPDGLCWAQGPERARQSVTAVGFVKRQRCISHQQGKMRGRVEGWELVHSNIKHTKGEAVENPIHIDHTGNQNG